MPQKGAPTRLHASGPEAVPRSCGSAPAREGKAGGETPVGILRTRRVWLKVRDVAETPDARVPVPVAHSVKSPAVAPSAVLPGTGCLRQPQVLSFVPIAEFTLWRRVHACTSPTPLNLSDRVIVWRVEDVRGWIQLQGGELNLTSLPRESAILDSQWRSAVNVATTSAEDRRGAARGLRPGDRC